MAVTEQNGTISRDIIVVDGGEIIEFGSHDELMAKKGKYYRLIEMQSLNSSPDTGLLG